MICCKVDDAVATMRHVDCLCPGKVGVALCLTAVVREGVNALFRRLRARSGEERGDEVFPFPMWELGVLLVFFQGLAESSGEVRCHDVCLCVLKRAVRCLQQCRGRLVGIYAGEVQGIESWWAGGGTGRGVGVHLL